MQIDRIYMDRDVVSRAIECMIDLLDHCAIDPDFEDDDPPESDGDDLDSDNAEDETPAILQFSMFHGAGCPIADSDYAVDDRPIDQFDEDGV